MPASFPPRTGRPASPGDHRRSPARHRGSSGPVARPRRTPRAAADPSAAGTRSWRASPCRGHLSRSGSSRRCRPIRSRLSGDRVTVSLPYMPTTLANWYAAVMTKFRKSIGISSRTYSLSCCRRTSAGYPQNHRDAATAPGAFHANHDGSHRSSSWQFQAKALTLFRCPLPS